jgi:hypothetical protein
VFEELLRLVFDTAALLQLFESLANQPMPAVQPAAPKAGSAKGLITIAPDFDEPLEDFKPFTG